VFRTSKVRSFAAIALAATLALAPAIAEARAGLGGSSGSRGSRTYSAPPSTATAPNAASPMARTTAPQSQPGFGANRPGAAPAAGGFFGSSLGRGLMGGLIGAGLIGLLMGNGLMGGLGSMMSILGLLLQVGLIFLLARWAFNRFFANRQPAPAGMSRSMFGGGSGSGPAPAPGPVSGGAGFGGGGFAPSSKLTLQGEDFSAFERLLTDTQHAFADEDVAKLRAIATPEMASYFEADIADLQRKGEGNRVSGVKLEQGDLSEAWREGGSDYATVAMRFSMVDTMIDRASGKPLPGQPDGPTEATEVWTFERPAGGSQRDWKVSAIQQV
jgi:predicted lipid-binding transport protein (Tim44 family)